MSEFTELRSADNDGDGCRDIDEDDDDDGDGVADGEDSCPEGSTDWSSSLATDLDHSGTLEPHELHTLLVVLGGNKPVEMHALMKIMEEAKVSPASRTRAP